MINNSFQNTSIQEEGSFDLKKEISYFLFFWPWFLLTISIAFAGSYFYIRYTPNVYSSYAQVQITKSDASSSFLTAEVTSLFGTRINVENDISVMTSNHILSQAVNHLDLQTTISKQGNVRSGIQFGDEIPFEIQFKNTNDFQNWDLLTFDDYVLISNDSLAFKINKNKK